MINGQNKTQKIRLRIPHEKEGQYFELPFEVPQDICRITIQYAYQRRYEEQQRDGSVRSRETTIVDLALRDGKGDYVGSSGSDRSEVSVSAWESSDGYARVETASGSWAIIVGAYKIPKEGAEVCYTISMEPKARRLLKGDLHLHTLGSDGSMSIGDTAEAARKAGLDFICITDHNNYAQNLKEADVKGITVIPGCEWTHYRGHAGLLGAVRPFDSAFCVNTDQEAREKLKEARRNGAAVVLNHPFCPYCGWHFGYDVPYDLIELVNGAVVPEANEACLRWWHEQLCNGAHLPVIGGSDFHRYGAERTIGYPTTCVYALSSSPKDIMRAIRSGHSFITVYTDGPCVDIRAGEAEIGDVVSDESELDIFFESLKAGDVLRLLTDSTEERLVAGEHVSAWRLRRSLKGAKFFRTEVLRRGRTVLWSNPVYFTEE